MTVHGDGSAARDWLFVEDHCDALDRIIHADIDKVIGQVINLGTGHDRSVLEIAESVKAIVQSGSLELVGAAVGRRRTDLIRQSTRRASGEISFVGDRHLTHPLKTD